MVSSGDVAEAAGMGGKVREVSCKRTFRGEILQARTGIAEHFLLLGETAENGLGHGVVAGRSGDSAAARFGDDPDRQQHPGGRGAFPMEVRHGGAGAGRLPGGDPLPGQVPRGRRATTAARRSRKSS